MQQGPGAYVFDPADPRAPTQSQWEAMSEAERARVIATLPDLVPIDIMAPEGDAHRQAKTTALDVLGSFFRRVGKKVYLSSELAAAELETLLQEERQAREEKRQGREEERGKREAIERELAEARAEIERLRKS